MQCHGHQSARPRRAFRVYLNLTALTLLAALSAPILRAQASSDSQATAGAPQRQASSTALLNTAGPDVTLENSEALFDIAVALNACGYDQGLVASDPIRLQVREQVNQALLGSAEARDARDQLCAFVDQHHLFR